MLKVTQKPLRLKKTIKKNALKINRNLIFTLAGFLLIPVIVAFAVQAQSINCHTGVDVVGATTEQPGPVFCTLTATGQSTSEAFSNAWDDRFNHNLSFADFSNTNYLAYKLGASNAINWLHGSHWMVDVDPEGAGGGGALRPNHTFKFEDNKFIVETVSAAGIQEYSNQIWPEIVISTNPHPNQSFPGLYLYDALHQGTDGNGYDTFGVRLQASRYPIAAYFRSTGGRLWEISSYQHEGKTIFGGHPGVIYHEENWLDLGKYWNECASPDNPDTECRDRFRLELEHNPSANTSSVTLFVNGAKYFEQTGLPAFSPEFLNNDLYVYMGSIHSVNGGVTVGEVVRFHWDDIIVNPHSSTYEDGGGEPSPSVSPTPQPSPSPSPVPDKKAKAFMNLVRRFFGVENTPENQSAILKAYYGLLEALGI